MNTQTDPQTLELHNLIRPLVEYVRSHGRLPRQSGNDRDEAERVAGNLLRTLRRRAQAEGKAGMDAKLRTLLDQTIPNWLTDEVRPAARGMRGIRTFEAQVYKAHRFMQRHNRLPSAASFDPREAAIGRFLRNHRQAVQGRGTASWSATKERLLDKLVPGWDLGTRARMAQAI